MKRTVHDSAAYIPANEEVIIFLYIDGIYPASTSFSASFKTNIDNFMICISMFKRFGS